MKKISLYISALVLGAVAMQSCDDNWVNPPMDVPTFPAGTEANMTIADLKTKYWQDNNSYGTLIGLADNGDSITVIGTVVSSDKSGNIYKSVILQDESAAITIGINQSDLYEEYPCGVAMAVNVTGLTIGRYNGLVQLGTTESGSVNRIELADFAPHALIDASKGKVDTISTSIAELAAAKSTADKIKWQSRLIRIDNVRFREAGQPFTTGQTTSRNIVDEDGNSIIVYNSSYSDFAYDILPSGNGSVVGILSCYRDAWQILLIDAQSCIGFDASTPDNGDEEKPAGSNELLVNGDEGWTYENTSNPDNIDYVWKWDSSRNYLKASAYVNESSHEAEAWAISPVIDLSVATAPVMAFDHALNYLRGAKISDYCNVFARIEGTTDWTSLTVPTWPSGSDWEFVNSGNIDLNAFVDKKIQIGLKFNSTSSNSSTWEIKNLAIYMDGTPDTPTVPDTPTTGKGSESDPFNVADIIAKGSGTSQEAVFVKGYIVGSCTDMDYTSATFTADGASNTNILLADDANCTDASKCIPVQLPSGSVRTALSLQQHPENLGKQVLLGGDIAKYFGQPGFKNTSSYKWADGTGTPETPDNPSEGGMTFLAGDNTDGMSGWTIEDVTVPDGLNNPIWTWKSYNNAYYLNGSAYGGTGNAEAWAISPVIELTGAMTASFEHTAKFQTTLKTACGFAIREEGTQAWTMLTIPTWPESGSWTFVNSGRIDLSAYAGKKVQVAFKYGATAEGADTWEIKNLHIN